MVSDTIVATDWHLVWVEEADDWVAIGDLVPGQHLHSPDGRASVVTAIRHFTQVSPVHDLTIDDIHAFYVGGSGTSLLVHNCGLRIYEQNPKHSASSKGSSKGVISTEPSNGQAALDNSVQIKETAPRRVGVSDGQTVILDRTMQVPCNCGGGGTNEIFHGHVRADVGRDPGMAKAAVALGKAIKRGLIDPLR